MTFQRDYENMIDVMQRKIFKFDELSALLLLMLTNLIIKTKIVFWRIFFVVCLTNDLISNQRTNIILRANKDHYKVYDLFTYDYVLMLLIVMIIFKFFDIIYNLYDKILLFPRFTSRVL